LVSNDPGYLAQRYNGIIKELFALCYYGRVGSIGDILRMSKHDKDLLVRELYRIKAEEEKAYSKKTK